MCIAGLRAAIEMLGKKRKWLQTGKEMSDAFAEIYSNGTKSIPRTYRKGSIGNNCKTKKEDLLADTSLLGLVYPSGILDPKNEMMKRAVLE
jgi:GH15 family glucan-1,4-alpha-glucosidase